MKIKKLYLLFIIIHFPSFSGFSQNVSNALPDWFFRTENYNRNNLAIGVSDPNPDTTIALNQAKINALINYSLNHGGSFSSLTNVGMGSQMDNNTPSSNLEYVLFTSIIKGKLPPLSAVKIKQKHFTPYKEAVVLLEIDNQAVIDNNVPKYVITKSAGFNKENNSFPFFIDELNIEVSSNDSVILESEISKEGSKFKDLKKPKGQSNFFENTNLKSAFIYPEHNSTENDSEWPFMWTPLGSGLWKAYIFNLVDQLSLYNSLDINCQYKLSTSNIGNISRPDQSMTFQQLVYSLKNVQSVNLNNTIAGIYLQNNNLHLAVKSGKNPGTDASGNSPGKQEKKLIKKMVAGNWKYLGNEDFETSWLKAMTTCHQSDLYLKTELDIQANSIQSGVLEGMQLAKLQLSSLLATKIQALGKTDVNTNNDLSIKSAKLINIEKTGSIGPYFIFYQNMAPNVYNIKLFVLYSLKQIDGL